MHRRRSQETEMKKRRPSAFFGGKILAVEFAWLDSAIAPHTLRHTRTTWVMQNGIDLWEASGHLGMSVKTLTDIHGHHHPDWQNRLRRFE